MITREPALSGNFLFLNTMRCVKFWAVLSAKAFAVGNRRKTMVFEEGAGKGGNAVVSHGK